MQITSLVPHLNVYIGDVPTEVSIKIFSYICDMKSYRSLRLSCRRFSHLSLEGHMENLFTFSNFIDALKNGKTPPMNQFKEYKIDFTNQEQEAIRVASQKGLDVVVFQLLQEPKVDPAMKNNLPLSFACSEGHKKVVELLLKDPRTSPSAGKNNPLLLASQNGHLEVVSLLLASPRLKLSDSDKMTISKIAQKKGLVKIFECLQTYQPMRQI